LLLPPVPLLLAIVIGAWMMRPRPGNSARRGMWLVMAGVLGLWLSACSGFAGVLQAQLLDASPALSAARLAELKSQAPAAPGKPGIAIVVLGGGAEAYAPEYGGGSLSRESLERLTRWCRRFSPTVGLEEAAGGAPECLHLDITGTAGFFGGEESLSRTVVWTLAARGVHARAAIADTPAAAWTAALAGQEPTSRPPAAFSAAIGRATGLLKNPDHAARLLAMHARHHDIQKNYA
jgi:hypothetical protein